MIETPDDYRGYKPTLEFGVYVWNRTTRTEVIARSMKSGKEIRQGTHMLRVVTNATDLDEAKKQLDRRLSRPKDPKTDLSGNYKMDF
jgi:beta-lactam-binding protein with PASTA domain